MSASARSRPGSSVKVGTAEVALSVVVILVVALLVVPLPTPVLDVLLAANLSAAVAILLVVLHVPPSAARRLRRSPCACGAWSDATRWCGCPR